MSGSATYSRDGMGDPLQRFDFWGLEDWPAKGRENLKAAIEEAHARQLETPITEDLDLSRETFDAIAEAFMEAGKLTEESLEKQIPAILHDVAFAGHWSVAWLIPPPTTNDPRAIFDHWSSLWTTDIAGGTLFRPYIHPRHLYWRAQLRRLNASKLPDTEPAHGNDSFDNRHQREHALAEYMQAWNVTTISIAAEDLGVDYSDLCAWRRDRSKQKTKIESEIIRRPSAS